MGLAARHDAGDHNPMRNVSTITAEKKMTRALTLDEARRLRASLRADERAMTRDIPVLVDFMLGTGLRIGEALAGTWDALDLEAATAEVRGTLTYVRGEGDPAEAQDRIGVADASSAGMVGAAGPRARREQVERGVSISVRQAPGPGQCQL